VQIAQNNLGFLRDCLFLIPARLIGKNVVVHLNGGYFGKFYKDASSVMRGIIRFALRRTARAVVLGDSLSDLFDGIIPRERVRVVPNGLEDKFAAWRNDASNGHRSTVLFLSTLMEEKGALDVLRALPAAKERVPDIRVVFAGEWFRRSDREKAEQLVRDLHLESQVEFPGAVCGPFKYELLKSADIFVLPTAYPFEGHPFVILEAMSAGLPIISTKRACIPETVRDGIEGFLLDCGDTDALAERMARLIGDERLRRQMGRASRERFLEQYTLDRFAERMRSVFAEVLGREHSEREAKIV
jgi:glycosyltransferase involved in cell wall biosynthesis